MSFLVLCPRCRRRVLVQESMVGQPAGCPYCTMLFQVLTPPHPPSPLSPRPSVIPPRAFDSAERPAAKPRPQPSAAPQKTRPHSHKSETLPLDAHNTYPETPRSSRTWFLVLLSGGIAFLLLAGLVCTAAFLSRDPMPSSPDQGRPEIPVAEADPRLSHKTLIQQPSKETPPEPVVLPDKPPHPKGDAVPETKPIEPTTAERQAEKPPLPTRADLPTPPRKNTAKIDAPAKEETVKPTRSAKAEIPRPQPPMQKETPKPATPSKVETLKPVPSVKADTAKPAPPLKERTPKQSRQQAARNPAPRITVGKPPRILGLDPFYEKYADAKGLPVISSRKVPDEALVTAAELILNMLAKRADLHRALIASNARVVVMGAREVTTDIPEHNNLTPKDYWDNRARGIGGNQTTSCGEENLLGYEDDRYKGESILVHEFAHTVHGLAMRIVDEGFDNRLKTLYEKAMAKGLWKQTYAATNRHEYWAEGVQSYFDCNLRAEPPDGIHNHVRTREELLKYDPDLYKLIDDVFAKNPWRWRPNGAHQSRWKKNESGSLPMGNSVGYDPQQDLKNKSQFFKGCTHAARWGQGRRRFAAAPALPFFPLIGRLILCA